MVSSWSKGHSRQCTGHSQQARSAKAAAQQVLLHLLAPPTRLRPAMLRAYGVRAPGLPTHPGGAEQLIRNGHAARQVRPLHLS